MSNVRNHKIETAKGDEDNMMLEPYTIQRKVHEKAFADFTRSHKSKLHHLQNKINSLTEADQNLQKILLQRDAIIKELSENIDIRNEEILTISETKNSLTDENKTLKQNLTINEKKFTILETSYDHNVASFRSELKEKQQEIESQNIKYNNINDELTKCRKNLAESFGRFQKLQESFDNYKLNSSQEYETNLTTLKGELTEMRAKLLQKDEELVQIREEKHKMEEAKNKIIDEQTFKINRIERVFDQPLQRVQPHLNPSSPPPPPTPNHSSTSPTQVSQSFVHSNDQYSVSVSTSTTRAMVTALPTGSSASERHLSARTRRYTRENQSQTSQAKEAACSSNQATAASTSTKSSKRRFIPVQNISTGSDSDSDISIASTNFLNSHRRNLLTSDTPVGFGSLKRPLAGSSNSSKDFDNLKRSKQQFETFET